MASKMDKKTVIDLKNSLCTTCLSRDRKLFPVNEVELLKGFFPDIKFGKYDKICWECKAIARKIMEFKSRTYKAQELLPEIMKSGLNNFESLSHLKILDTDVLSYNNPDTNQLQLTAIKEEAVKIEINLDLHYDGNAGETNVAEDTDPASQGFVAVTCTAPESIAEVVDPKDIDAIEVPALGVERDKIEILSSSEDSMPLVGLASKINLSSSSPVQVSEPFRDLRTGKRLHEILKEITVTQAELDEIRVKKVRSLRGFRCLDCLKGFKDKAALDIHNVKHSDKSGNYSCKICKQRFLTVKKLDEHTEMHFTVIECLFCAHKTFEVEVMIKHFYRNHQKRNMECLECDVTFATVRDLQIHKSYAHIDTKDCQECGKTFKSLTTLKRHMRIHKGLNERNCPVCRKKLLSEAGLKLHLKSHDEKEAPMLQCPKCDKKYSSKSGLRMHQKTHERTIDDEAYCAECCVQYKSKRIYKMHLKTSMKHLSQEDLKFQCPLCERRFSKRDIMKNHMMVHSDNNYKCDHCKQTFLTKRTLRKHITLKHLGKRRERKYVCDICAKAFYNNWSLQQHLNAHLGNRPFVCDMCPVAFSFQGSLFTHKRIHHGIKKKKKIIK